VNGDNFYAYERSFLTPNRRTIVLKKIDRIHGGKEKGFIDATLEWLNHPGKPICARSGGSCFTPAGRSGFWISLDFDCPGDGEVWRPP
jgi:hypothetical protein